MATEIRQVRRSATAATHQNAPECNTLADRLNCAAQLRFERPNPPAALSAGRAEDKPGPIHRFHPLFITKTKLQLAKPLGLWDDCSAMKVLVIEDFALIRKSVAEGLREAGFSVDANRRRRRGLWFATSGNYDVIVLDLMLPKLDGLSILKSFASRNRRRMC
jgi:hypothetical protein